MKTAVSQVSRRWCAGGTSRYLFHLCSTCGPAKRGQVERPQSFAPSQKLGAVPLGPPKNNIPPHLRATALLWPCVGFSRAGRKPAPPGQWRRRWTALRERKNAPSLSFRTSGEIRFSVPVQSALWAKIPHPLDVGYGSRIKGGSSHPPLTTPDGRADRENGSFPRLSAPACWICTKGTILSSYTLEV